ncbi:ATP-binding cassette domain-containing protein [Geochorda subterranea]|uniref:ATP-binding cassette domain-containing protein n=1 Tax=Geochorda subterranea TaxID=3109564 RepID=A0ABZ1BRB4_9FIRM|nr:ATP-binding cassette domain-containing protein [Limnochorda sp. LNt]WRP15165.1 ATP-binding cassette domain-containing protein [Limnochorda sp. LNt]
MIQLVQVGKRFGQRWAVQDLTCSVEPGEVLGFLGPNGAGKSTTMRIVTGYMPPTTGSVRVAGVDALDDPVRLKSRVGYLPEIPPSTAR